MAVRLRLRRVGRKKAPIYKVVAADSRSPRDGRYIESVGQYEPLRQSNNVEFKEDRVMYWLQNGAQPTDTVRNLLSSQGLWLKWSLLKKGADQAAIGEQMEKFALQRAEKEKRAQEKASQKKKKAAPETQETPEAQPDAAEQKASKEPSEPAKTPETQEPPAVKEQVSDEPVKETEQETKPDKKAEEKKEETPEDKAENQESEKKE